MRVHDAKVTRWNGQVLCKPIQSWSSARRLNKVLYHIAIFSDLWTIRSTGHNCVNIFIFQEAEIGYHVTRSRIHRNFRKAMRFDPPLASFAQLYQQVLYRTPAARLHRARLITALLPSLSPITRAAHVAFASTAAAFAETSHGYDNDGPVSFEQSPDSIENSITTHLQGSSLSRHILKLYREQLRVLKETNDRDGIMQLWGELKSRKAYISPTNTHGNLLWQELLKSSLISPVVLRELWEYALNLKHLTGLQYSGLYETIVAYFLLNGRAQMAYEWHKTIKADYDISKSSFSSILSQIAFRPGILSRQSNEMLQLIYKESDQHDVYDLIVPSICASTNYKRAFRWHKLLLKSEDFPTPTVAKNPQILAMLAGRLGVESPSKSTHHDPDDTKVSLEGSQEEDDISDQHPLFMIKEAMSRELGNVHGVAEKHVSDDFCARLFATTLFPINIAISGLGFIGVKTLGPTAVRELAVRCLNGEEFLKSLHTLEEAKISLRPCVYSNLMVKAAYEDEELFESMVVNDHHPDNFEDLKLQQELLHSYIASKDWLQAHRALTVLAILRPVQTNPSSANNGIWNFVLKLSTAPARDLSMKHLLNQLLVNKEPVNNTGLKSIGRKYLKPHLHRRPDLSLSEVGSLHGMDPLDMSLVLNVFLRIQTKFRPLPPLVWTDIIQRLGMLGRFQELARLSLWLTASYPREMENPNYNQPQISSPASLESESSIPGVRSQRPMELEDEQTRMEGSIAEPSEPSEPMGALDFIFSIDTQFSIVAWGFLGQLPRAKDRIFSYSSDWFSNRTSPDCELWACGIKLLRLLQENGAPIYTDRVRQIVTERLWMLFGTMKFTRWENRYARLKNPHSLTHMINHVNLAVWPGLFDDIAPFLLDERNGRSKDLFHTVFRRQLLKREGFWEQVGRDRMQYLGSIYKSSRQRLKTCPKPRRLTSVKGVKQRKRFLRGWTL